MHIAIGAALGEAAKRIEGAISTGGMIVVGGLALAVIVVVVVRKRRKAGPGVAVADEADAELEPA